MLIEGTGYLTLTLTLRMLQARAGANVVHSPCLRDCSGRDPAVRCRLHRAVLHHERALAAPGLLPSWSKYTVRLKPI